MSARTVTVDFAVFRRLCIAAGAAAGALDFCVIKAEALGLTQAAGKMRSVVEETRAAVQEAVAATREAA